MSWTYNNSTTHTGYVTDDGTVMYGTSVDNSNACDIEELKMRVSHLEEQIRVLHEQAKWWTQ